MAYNKSIMTLLPNILMDVLLLSKSVHFLSELHLEYRKMDLPLIADDRVPGSGILPENPQVNREIFPWNRLWPRR